MRGAFRSGRTDAAGSETQTTGLCLADVRAANDQPGAAPGLNDQLLLDKLAKLATEEAPANRIVSATTSAAAFARFCRGWLRRRVPSDRRSSAAEGIWRRRQAVRPWAAEPLECTELLTRLENYENTESAADAQRLAEIRRQLTWSTKPSEQALARRLEMHYRNANVRVAITAALIDRLLPEPTPTNEPVNERFLCERFQVRCNVDPAIGRIGARCQHLAIQSCGQGKRGIADPGNSGPVTFFESGPNHLRRAKLVLANAYGTRILPAVAEAAAYQSLNGLSTEYDSIPIVRSMVRNYAMGQHAELEGQAQAEAEQCQSRHELARIDAEFEPRVTAAQDKFRNRVVEPLKKLGLTRWW